MVYYSGKDFNDLGNYHGCNELDGANYVLLDATKSVGLVAVIGWCLPEACSIDEITEFFTGIMDDLTSKSNMPNSNEIKAISHLLDLAGLQLLKSDFSLPFEVVFPKEEQDRLQSEYPAGVIIMILICSVLVIVTATATGIDMY